MGTGVGLVGGTDVGLIFGRVYEQIQNRPCHFYGTYANILLSNVKVRGEEEGERKNIKKWEV